jgi:hypothetical protein
MKLGSRIQRLLGGGTEAATATVKTR